MAQLPEVSAADFARYAEHVPGALALREAMRMHHLRRLSDRLHAPLIDIGCGDGFFAVTMFTPEQRLEHDGIDINWREVAEARKRSAYRTVMVGDVVRHHLPLRSYRTIIANCSLEHIPDLDGALRSLRAHAAPGCLFLAFVPTPHWSLGMTISGLPWIGPRIARAIDRIFVHEHLLDAEEWRGRCVAAGWEVEAVEPVGTAPFISTYEALMPFSVPNFFYRKMTKIRWEPIESRWMARVKVIQYWFARTCMVPVMRLAHAFLRPRTYRDHYAEYLVLARCP